MRTLNFIFVVAMSLAVSFLTSCTDELEGQSIGNGFTAQNPVVLPPGTEATTGEASTTSDDCTKGNGLDTSRGACGESLSVSSSVNMSVSGNTRTIQTNNIPDHMVGLFGNASGSLNPNAISEQSSTYRVTADPQFSSRTTELLGANGPAYSFGVLLNGVELDPVAAEPWPHVRGGFSNVNWEWNLEATNVRIGLDCNNAHVQPTGKYHYHGIPTLYISQLSAGSNEMTLIGYAADGFPIYNQYAYAHADNANSPVVEMISSFRLKQGERPGDGVDAPCGTYNGVYSNDYEYVVDAGHLDECNGRTGVTPEYPDGTYYYVITQAFPSIPRCFVGTPSNDFRLGF